MEETRLSLHEYGWKLLDAATNLPVCPVKEFVSDSEAFEYWADQCSESEEEEMKEEQ